MTYSHFHRRHSALPVNNATILIVEDDPKALIILSEQLQYFGFESVGVDNGLAALDWLSHNDADMIILDLMLPGMHGFEICRRVREIHSVLSLPILMLSARGDNTADRVKGLQAGANDFMAKPYDVSELIARINNLLTVSIQRHNFELKILNKVSKAITASLDLDAILYEVVKITSETIDATSAYVCDIDFHTDTMTVLAEHFSSEATILERLSYKDISYSINMIFRSLTRWQHDTHDLYIIHVDDPVLDPYERAEMVKYDAKSILRAPLVAKDQVFGYIELWESRQERQFSEDEVQLVQAIADHVAMTIVNVRLHQDLQQSEAISRDLLDNAYDLIERVGFDGCFTYVNASWLKTFGFTQSEALDMHYEQLLRPDQTEHYRRICQLLQKGESVADAELVFITKTGIEVMVEANFTPHMDDGLLKSIRGILRNITQRKLAEQHRIALVMEQEKMHVLNQFISDASHDLKTPLSAAFLSHYFLKLTAGTEKQAQHISNLGDCLNHLKRLLEDMFTMSHLDQIGILTFEATDLNGIIRDMVRRFDDLLTHHQHQLIIELDEHLLTVEADVEQLQRALSNLIENALVYTPNSGTITIRTIRQEQEIIIEVQDNGIGIAETHLPHIFDRFYRVDKSRNTALGGTGLGLAIVKTIIEQHAGTIQVQSALEEGTTFRIRLTISS